MKWQKITALFCFFSRPTKTSKCATAVSPAVQNCLLRILRKRKYFVIQGRYSFAIRDSWRWDIHHSCCVGQTWLSNSSRAKSSWSRIPFFPFLFRLLAKARNWKLVHPWVLGGIQIFLTIKSKKSNSSIHPLASLSKILHTPQSHHPAHTNSHTKTYTFSDMCAHKPARALHTNS